MAVKMFRFGDVGSSAWLLKSDRIQFDCCTGDCYCVGDFITHKILALMKLRGNVKHSGASKEEFVYSGEGQSTLISFF